MKEAFIPQATKELFLPDLRHKLEALGYLFDSEACFKEFCQDKLSWMQSGEFVEVHVDYGTIQSQYVVSLSFHVTEEDEQHGSHQAVS